jgi:hypothetical protein
LRIFSLIGAQVTNYCAAPIARDCGFSAPTNRNFLRVKDVNGNYLLNNNPGAPFQSSDRSTAPVLSQGSIDVFID